MASSSQSFFTFAYGSNMLRRRIMDKNRCPSARAMGTAFLPGYELKWHKRSQDGSGKCDLVQTDDANSVVHGVLYEIPSSEKSALDRAEGLGFGYDVEEVAVNFNGDMRLATIYYATDIDASLKPYTWYKGLVIAGAKEHGLPGKYVDLLMATDAIEDRDRERHDHISKLLTT